MGHDRSRKLANLLLVDGKPDQDIPDTRRITAIIYQGKILDREKLKFTPASQDFVVVGTALMISITLNWVGCSLSIPPETLYTRGPFGRHRDQTVDSGAH